MREFEIKPELHKQLLKLSKKDKTKYEAIIKKINEVVNSHNIEHYKNLQHNLKNLKRVHIGHFVLVFSYDKTKNYIIFEDYDHHDNIYNKKKKPKTSF